jgi:hypothetical protein
MRKLLILAGFFIFYIPATQSQVVERKMKVYAGISHFITGSGFAPATELYLMVGETRKNSLAVGINLGNEYNSITGISINHEIFLLRKTQVRFEPLLFYNFIYRKTVLPEIFKDNSPGKYGTIYSSVEHHIGAGLKINITKTLFFSAKFGFGPYLGSIKKPVTDPVSMKVFGSNGLGLIIKADIGFILM